MNKAPKTGHVHWKGGALLTVKAFTDPKGNGLRYRSAKVVATSDGFAGGWDMWEGLDDAGAKVSFYGFSVVDINGKEAW